MTYSAISKFHNYYRPLLVITNLQTAEATILRVLDLRITFTPLQEASRLNRMVQSRYFWPLSLLTLMLVHHASLWILISQDRQLAWSQLLSNWDSGWYNSIIDLGGYSTPKSWAFYPLYPAIASILTFNGAIHPAISGATFSFVCFLSSLFFMFRCNDNELLKPKFLSGYFVFLYSPASHVFHSHHTESLFLLLSFFSFYLCFKNRFLWAAVVAGLCALTRNQGVLVSIAVGIWAWQQYRANRIEAFLKFAKVGLISGLIFSLFPLYQYHLTSYPFNFLSAQENWTHASSVYEVVRTLWMGNPWQTHHALSYLRHLWFIVLLIGSVFLCRRHLALGLYSVTSMLVILLQGETVNAFRFTAVLFTLLFFLGDQLMKAPRWLQLGIILLIVLVNHHMTRNYAIGRWSY